MAVYNDMTPADIAAVTGNVCRIDARFEKD